VSISNNTNVLTRLQALTGEAVLEIQRKERHYMDTTTLIRIIAGVLAVAVIMVVIYRRKQAKA
jgi:hypothetical protein